MLVAFDKKDSSAEAFGVLRTTLLRGGARIRRTVGFRGGAVETEVTWHGSAGIWTLLDPDEAKNRFWCCFGVQNPKEVKSLDIAVEVNPRLKGTDLRVAGAFARDVRGIVHLCHNGKIGGGKRGVGKRALFNHYRGEWAEMVYRDRIVDVVDLGSICDPRLPGRLGWFAREILRVKGVIASTSGGLDTSVVLPGGLLANGSPGFVPEFSGVRKRYSLQHVVEAKADHGTVVDALAASVEKLGHRPYNDRARDLFTLDERNDVAMLFEVKTDVTSNSIYTAVGQLLLNGRAANSGTRMILVVPGRPVPETHEALNSIGIDVLAYRWVKREPVISIPELQCLMR